MPILKDTIHGVLVLAAYGDVLEDKVRMGEYVRRVLEEGARRIVVDVSRVDAFEHLFPGGAWGPMQSWVDTLVRATRLALAYEAEVAWVIRGFDHVPTDLQKGFSEVVFRGRDVRVYGTREDALNSLKESD